MQGSPGGDPALPWFASPLARLWACPVSSAVRNGEVRAFHAGLPGYAPTPLTEVPALAAELGAGRVFVKDESARLGLPAFKVLGASWAVHQLLVSGPGGRRTGGTGAGAPATLAELRSLAAGRAGLVFVTATDGNHGRAVARMARLVGTPARVFVPAATQTSVVAAIAGEGAEVTQVAGSYDEAVAAAAGWARARPAAELVQDTAWPGYEQVPAWIAEGYSTLFAETDAQLAAAGVAPPALVATPVGVGSLAQAAVAHYRAEDPPPGQGPPAGSRTALLAVEPDTAACLLASLHAGSPVSVPTGTTIMAGLNCGTVSTIAWPYLSAGLDAAVAVSDAAARRAVASLAAAGISAGPSGAASLAGARAALTGPGSAGRRTLLATAPVVVLLSTEAGA